MVESSVSPERWRHDGGVAGALRHIDGVQRFGERADLVDLDQDRVGHALSMPSPGALMLVTNRSSPTSWACRPAVGQHLPAVPIILAPCRPRSRRWDSRWRAWRDISPAPRSNASCPRPRDVVAFLEEFGRGAVETNAEVVPGLSRQARSPSCRSQRACAEGSSARNPLIADIGVKAAFFSAPFSLWKISAPQRTASLLARPPASPADGLAVHRRRNGSAGSCWSSSWRRWSSLTYPGGS